MQKCLSISDNADLYTVLELVNQIQARNEFRNKIPEILIKNLRYRVGLVKLFPDVEWTSIRRNDWFAFQLPKIKLTDNSPN